MKHIAAPLTPDRFTAILQASDSSTRVLTELIGSPIVVELHHQQENCRPSTREQALLELTTEPVIRRATTLNTPAGLPLCQAELAIAGHRLPQRQHAALRAKNIPFGQLLAELSPRRHTLYTSYLPNEHTVRLEVLLTAAAGPIALSNEAYLPGCFTPQA